MNKPTPISNAQRFWSAHLDAIDASGMRVSDYARERGLSAASLYTWRSRLARQRAPRSPSDAPRFAELVATTAAAAFEPTEGAATAALAVRVGDAQLEFATLPEPQWLAAFVDTCAGVRSR